MILGIDASNIRAGGGVTHIVELLRAADPLAHGFSQVLVWSGQSVLDRIEDRAWLVKSHDSLLDRSLLFRTFWQTFKLSRLARMAGCGVLFVPGGSYVGGFQPIVAFSQNLLPFERRELWRYGWSFITFKMMLLRWTQSRTFRQADGLIFLTQYAQDAVMRLIKSTTGKTTIIPHGVDNRFACPPRKQIHISQYSVDLPFRILYVSRIDEYKHQWHVAEAVAQLRKMGFPVVLELVGPAYPPALKRLRQSLGLIDPNGEFVRYYGVVPYTELHFYYAHADLCVFASSCETFGQILAEAMSAGLPIACSNRSAMPEVLKDAGVYFDPEKPSEIALAIISLINSPELRDEKANEAYRYTKSLSWEHCAHETFRFLAWVAVGNNY